MKKAWRKYNTGGNIDFGQAKMLEQDASEFGTAIGMALPGPTQGAADLMRSTPQVGDPRMMGFTPPPPSDLQPQGMAVPYSNLKFPAGHVPLAEKRSANRQEAFGRAAQIGSAVIPGLSLGIAATQYEMPDMSINYTPVVPQEVDFSNQIEQIKQDTTSFDTAVKSRVGSTPLMAALMTARRGTARRQIAQVEQQESNLNLVNEFRAKLANSRMDLQTEMVNLEGRKEAAKFRNEQVQKQVDATSDIANKFGMLLRDDKVDASDAFRAASDILTSNPKSSRWYIHQLAKAKGIEQTARQLGVEVSYVQGKVAEVERLGVDVAESQAMEAEALEKKKVETNQE